MITVPEFILLGSLRAGLNYVIDDYKTHAAAGTESSSFLYLLCEGAEFERYNYIEQAKAILIKEQDDPRLLTIDMMYNMKTNGAPHVYISLPAEQTAANALGVGEGQYGYIYTDTVVDNNTTTTDVRAVLTRRKASTYHVVITSDNVNEVVLLYHFFNALVMSLQAHLALSGLENISYSGRDIEPYSELMPTNLYMRALMINLEYQAKTLSIPPQRVIEKMVFLGKAVLKL